jgi:hypothetical protein
MASNFELSDEQPAAAQQRRPREKGELIFRVCDSLAWQDGFLRPLRAIGIREILVAT